MNVGCLKCRDEVSTGGWVTGVGSPGWGHSPVALAATGLLNLLGILSGVTMLGEVAREVLLGSGSALGAWSAWYRQLERGQ